MLRIYGKVKENSHEQLKTKVCSVCGYENLLEVEYCLRYRRPLSIRVALKVEDILSIYLPKDKIVEAKELEEYEMRVSKYSRAYGICRERGLEKSKNYTRKEWDESTSTKIQQWCGGWDLNPRRPTPQAPQACPVNRQLALARLGEPPHVLLLYIPCI